MANPNDPLTPPSTPPASGGGSGWLIALVVIILAIVAYYVFGRSGGEHAPDMVQEVFARAAGSQQATQLANPVAFIRRITRNMLIDRARRKEANKVVLCPLDDERHLSAPPEQGLAIEAQDLLRIYHKAVADLPEKTRVVFLLSRDQHLTNRQISEKLGVTVKAVEYHMTRALAYLATVVEAHR